MKGYSKEVIISKERSEASSCMKEGKFYPILLNMSAKEMGTNRNNNVFPDAQE